MGNDKAYCFNDLNYVETVELIMTLEETGKMLKSYSYRISQNSFNC